MGSLGNILGHGSHSHSHSHSLAPANSNSNTLPMRSSNSGHLGINGGGAGGGGGSGGGGSGGGQHLSHAHSQQLPFIPQSKHANPCQSVKTLPFGFGFAGGQQKLQQQQQQQQMAKSLPKDMQDLIHLSGPLTEHAVMRTLQARFNEQRYFVSISGKRLFKPPLQTPKIVIFHQKPVPETSLQQLLGMPISPMIRGRHDPSSSVSFLR